jgi:hypothetical protein
MNFAIFLRNFDEILPEFHRNVQEMTNCLEILRKSARDTIFKVFSTTILTQFSFSF